MRIIPWEVTGGVIKAYAEIGNRDAKGDFAVSFNIACPNCSMYLAVTEADIGKQGKCSRCGSVFEITPPASSPPPPGAGPSVLPAVGGGTFPPEKPGKVQAIAIMTLIGGILATIDGIGMVFIGGIMSMGLCCLWPGGYYSLVLGIMAIVASSKLLGQQAHLEAAPKTIAIMQIINIINGDVPNCVMGIISLVFMNEPEVQRYFRG